MRNKINNISYLPDTFGFDVVAKNGYGDYESVKKITKNGHTYYPLEHQSTYGIRIYNKTDTIYNVNISIDGENVGKFRLNSYKSHIIKRPAHSKRSFVFVNEDSNIASSNGIVSGSNLNGLVEVEFVPLNTIQDNILDDDYDSLTSGFLDSFMFMSNLSNGFAPPPSSNSSAEINYSMSMSDRSFGMSNSVSNEMSYSTNNLFGMSDSYGSGATVLGKRSNQIYTDAIEYEEITNESVTKRARIIIKYDDYTPLSRSDRVPPRVTFISPPPPPFRETRTRSDVRYDRHKSY